MLTGFTIADLFDWLPGRAIAKVFDHAFKLTGTWAYWFALDKLAGFAVWLPGDLGAWTMIVVPIVVSTVFGVRNLRAYEANLPTIGLMLAMAIVPTLALSGYLEAIGMADEARAGVCFGAALLCVAPTKVAAIVLGLTQWQVELFLARRGMLP